MAQRTGVKRIIVSGAFDDLRSWHVRFLQEASRIGKVFVVLWSDRNIVSLQGENPQFLQEERLYLLQALRYVHHVEIREGGVEPEASAERDALPLKEIERIRPDVWAVDEESDAGGKRSFCRRHGLEYRVIPEASLRGFPYEIAGNRGGRSGGAGKQESGRKSVIVTGCFDWFHSGHVRFFEEVSELGELTVVVGHDQNVRLLKGTGHPLFPEEERRYMVGAVRYVEEALISTGHGWLDAEPEIERLKPDIYAVNEDGDRPEKAAFCRERGIDYVVLRRTPREGLPRRESTKFRGF